MNLSTQRCSLRSFKSEDFDNLRKLDCEPDIMKFTPARVPQTSEQTKARLERYSKMDGVWAAELKETREFVGWFMLIKTDLEFPEIGFMIVKDLWGKGLATEIGKALCDFAFNVCSDDGLSARTNDDNVASIAVLKKIGFVETGKLQDLKLFTLKKP